MNSYTAPVETAGAEEHPSSGEDLMRIDMQMSYPFQGPYSATTRIWVRTDIEPVTGEIVSWSHRHAVIRGITYDKPFNDENPAVPYH